jgi:putative membrane protein
MKHALFIAAATVAALSLVACNKPASKTAADAGNTASTTASDATQATGQAVNKAEDATGAAVGATSAATPGSHDTAAFASNDRQGDLYEIEAAKIAERRSKTPDIKAFARLMVRDHTRSSETMRPLIVAAGLTPVDNPGHDLQGLIATLNSVSDADFDKTYIDQQVTGHEEVLALLQGYAKDGSNAGLKGGAAEFVPMVRMHLDKAKAIQAKLKT